MGAHFYAVVPALTVSFVDALIVSKDKMTKRGKEVASGGFTDDGFALGLAYILRVLGQDSEFESLHWFQSVELHYAEESTRLEKEARQLGEAAKSRSRMSGMVSIGSSSAASVSGRRATMGAA